MTTQKLTVKKDANVERRKCKLEQHRARQKHQSINHHYRTKEKNKSERAIRKREKKLVGVS